MDKSNPKVDAFIARQPKWRDELAAIRAIALHCGLVEEIKWGKPCYTWDSHVVMVLAPFKEHAAIIFFKGALLKDPAGLLVKAGEATHAGRQMRFTDAKRIAKQKATVKAYIDEAVAAEKAGLKVDPGTKPVTPVPEELKTRLAADPALKKAFTALTTGRQRAYLLYFNGAKQAKTRIARIDKHAPRILSGKGLDD